jgi:hypothetical protein
VILGGSSPSNGEKTKDKGSTRKEIPMTHRTIAIPEPALLCVSFTAIDSRTGARCMGCGVGEAFLSLFAKFLRFLKHG